MRQPPALRIVGGAHKGRRIRGHGAHRGLRPTASRARESLFNCLGQQVRGWRCLDLFAGSGALGLEALSRGAAQVVWVEKNFALATHLRELAREFVAAPSVRRMSAGRFLRYPPQAFDLVFLDPPFADFCEARQWRALLADVAPWLAADALVYCESAFAFSAPGWRARQQRRCGAVFWQLLQRDEAAQ